MNRLISRQDAAELLQCTEQTISNLVATGVLTGHVKNGRLFVDPKTIMDNLDTVNEAARSVRLLERLTRENEEQIKGLEKAVFETKLAFRMWNTVMARTLTKEALNSIVLSYKPLLTEFEYGVLKCLMEHSEVDAVATHFGLTSARIIQIAHKAIKKISKARRYDDLLADNERLNDENERLKAKIADMGERVDEYDKTQELFKKDLREFDLSCRCLNCLRAAEIYTVGELLQHTKADLLKFRNFGKKSLVELEILVCRLGLDFGMNKR